MKVKKIKFPKAGSRLATKAEKDTLARKIEKDMKAWGKKTLGG